MGTDIHFYVERKVTGKWLLTTGMEKNDFYDPDDPLDVEYSPIEIEIGRRSDLFAVLAGVRNNICISPIDAPRGLPKDICEEIKMEHRSWDGDAFSESWLSIEELFSYDWEQVIQKEAYVESRVSYLFKDNPLGFPHENWPSEIQLSYAAWMRDGASVKWREKIGVLCGWSDLRKQVLELVCNHPIEEFRCVFWFEC